MESKTELAAPKGGFERLPEEWVALMKEWGVPGYRGRQIFGWIHKQGVFDYGKMSNLPKALRARLQEEESPFPLSVASTHLASDATKKLLISLADERNVEAVLIPPSHASAAEV